MEKAYLTKSGGTDAIGPESGSMYLYRPSEWVSNLIRLELIIASTDTDYNKFGSLPTLATGIRIVEVDDADDIIRDLTLPVFIQNNTDIVEAFDTVNYLTPSATGLSKFTKATLNLQSLEVVLNSTRGNAIAVIMNDDFTGLTRHRYKVYYR